MAQAHEVERREVEQEEPLESQEIFNSPKRVRQFLLKLAKIGR